jgi:PEP-CTERM motif
MKLKLCIALSLAPFLALPAAADSFFFSTGSPDGLIGTLSRPASGGVIQTETADDFLLTQSTLLKSATFTGLIPAGTPLSSITQVEVEFYHVFPLDSANPPSGNVPVRTNSPGDVEIAAATRDSAAGNLSFSASVVNPSFAVANTVVTGINKVPDEFTDGEGPASGQEALISLTFDTPVSLGADRYFFRPEVLLDSGNFLWLSAPKPIVAPDLQTWTRNDNLAPDWLRVGPDITHQGPFNAAFSLSGNTVPEPSTWTMFAAALGVLAIFRKKVGSSLARK